MPNKWKKPYSLGEIFNATLDSTLRILKFIVYGWDGSNAVAIKTDSSGRVAIEKEGSGAVGDGTKSVTTAGSAVQLSSTSVTCRKVWIQASSANTGVIVVGGSTVVAAEATRRGRALWPTQGDWFNVNNLNLLYIDSTVNGEKVNFYYEN